VQKIFEITFGAGKAAGLDPKKLKAEGFDVLAHAEHCLIVKSFAAHNATPADRSARQLELRLDEDKKRSPGFGYDDRRLNDFANRDEGNVDDDKVDWFRDVCDSQLACIALYADNAWIVAQLPIELFHVDVHGIDARGALLKQAVGEATVG